MNELIDWRGNTYRVGDTIVYPRMSGRSVEMSDGVVLEIYEVYRDRTTFRWERVTDAGIPEGASRELRVRVKPTGLGSRGFWRGDWSNYIEVRTGKAQADVKPVTIVNIENITALVASRDDFERHPEWEACKR